MDPVVSQLLQFLGISDHDLRKPFPLPLRGSTSGPRFLLLLSGRKNCCLNWLVLVKDGNSLLSSLVDPRRSVVLRSEIGMAYTCGYHLLPDRLNLGRIPAGGAATHAFLRDCVSIREQSFRLPESRREPIRLPILVQLQPSLSLAHNWLRKVNRMLQSCGGHRSLLTGLSHRASVGPG